MGSAKAVVYKWDSAPDEVKTALLGEYIPYHPAYVVAGKDWETTNLVATAMTDALNEINTDPKWEGFYWVSRTNLDGMYIRVVGRRGVTSENPRAIFGRLYAE